jgi:hypothetical protein
MTHRSIYLVASGCAEEDLPGYVLLVLLRVLAVFDISPTEKPSPCTACTHEGTSSSGTCFN